jgi:hypothetical protein
MPETRNITLEYVPTRLFRGYRTLFSSSMVTVPDTDTPLYKNNRDILVKDVTHIVLSYQLPT